MIEGNLRHPVTGTPQGGVISPLLANIYLSAIDERYKRWIPDPREGVSKVSGRHSWDRKLGRPTFYMVRYADDFVVLVQGTRQEAEEERHALAQFLKEELRMELSMEKTRITDVREGFDFLGYRVVQQRSPATGRHVGNLFIPKSKLQLLRDKIKGKVRKTPTGRTLADLIDTINPMIIGWRNYYRYASRAWKEFGKLDWWLDQRITLWLRRKHDKTTWAELFRQYAQSRSGKRKRWQHGKRQVALFAEAHQKRFPDRGIRIPNGWNATPDEWFLNGADKFWEATNTLALL